MPIIYLSLHFSLSLSKYMKKYEEIIQVLETVYGFSPITHNVGPSGYDNMTMLGGSLSYDSTLDSTQYQVGQEYGIPTKWKTVVVEPTMFWNRWGKTDKGEHCIWISATYNIVEDTWFISRLFKIKHSSYTINIPVLQPDIEYDPDTPVRLLISDDTLPSNFSTDDVYEWVVKNNPNGKNLYYDIIQSTLKKCIT
jgi:hypothetical protein